MLLLLPVKMDGDEHTFALRGEVENHRQRVCNYGGIEDEDRVFNCGRNLLLQDGRQIVLAL